MAYVDFKRHVLVLRVVLSGPPASGKSTLLRTLAGTHPIEDYAKTPVGPSQVARVSLPTHDERGIELEVYEWHGSERADRRGQALTENADGLILILDARGERQTDTRAHLKFTQTALGLSHQRTTPTAAFLGREDQGALSLHHYEDALEPFDVRLSYDPRDLSAPPISTLLLSFGEVLLTANRPG